MTDEAKIVVRPITLADKDEWKFLWRRYLSFYSTIRDDALYEHTFARLLDPAYPGMFAYVAQTQGHLIGLVNCIVHDHGWYQEKVVYLQDLYVDESARGKGTGRLLIEQVYAQADRLGMASVYWTTQTNNHTAMKLYDKVARKTDFIKYQR
ncbi:GNAT family N-acetyltransferase [Acerihabitans arboris]|uniref:GNAT family N-acetyltransferase n=1 Tax=Acerihabitans arboris TaxID=2691583 RepID=A0A845SQW7_9GAMM|nr:GNAT family N-acetyltransferase [Acerihabitans arboris]NDL65752.1 GNAT family N-acetyltransferase [Acerihabitans arboris]